MNLDMNIEKLDNGLQILRNCYMHEPMAIFYKGTVAYGLKWKENPHVSEFSELNNADLLEMSDQNFLALLCQIT